MIVTEVIPAIDSVDESDAYLEVKVRFGPHLQRVYCYFEEHEGGPDKGYIEIGFDEYTGNAAEVVVIIRPAGTGVFPADVPVVEGSIRANFDRWAELADRSDPQINFVRQRGAMSVSTKDKMTYYAFSAATPDRFVRSGSVGFGVGEAGELLGFVTGLVA
ncbi:hypothetical protein [Kibdelosporangium aridum]|uniref:hypothetical protein n=1 Tax=Kibdelosporangium aridum TaxID=2030 RepID=UPI00052791FB